MNKTVLKKFKIIFLIPIILLVSFYIIHINQFIIINSKSMTPSLNIGDLVYFEPKYSDFQNINADPISGDIIVIRGARFYYDNGVDPFLFAYLKDTIPIVHRAINKFYNETSDMWYFETKGDYNAYSDGCVHGMIEDGFAIFILNQSDPLYIPESEILGIVTFVIPGVGYIGMYFPVIFVVIMFLSLAYILFRMLGFQVYKSHPKERESE